MPRLTTEFTISQGLKDLFQTLTKPEITRIQSKVLVALGTLVQSTARKEFLSGGAGKLNVRTGRFRNSVTVEKRGLPRWVDVGSNLIYAPVHEFGAVIRPKAAPRLVFRVGPKAHLGRGPVRTAKQVTIPARPVFAPALARRESSLPEVAIRVIAKEIGL